MPGPLSVEVQDAIEQCQRILDLIEDAPEWALDKAPDFFEDVGEKVADVCATIEKLGRVSDRQLNALNGWENGVRKWHKD